MKKVLTSILVLSALSLSALAQDNFKKGSEVSLRGGVGYTVGESSVISDLLSGAAAFDYGYRFTPFFTLRADLSGWEGRGVNKINTGGKTWRWGVNYIQLAADAKFKVINIFDKSYNKLLNPYIFAGAGAQYRFHNGARETFLPDAEYLKEFKKFSYVIRWGVGLDFKISNSFSAGLEIVDNLTDDTFNSKKGPSLDSKFDLLAGVTYSFGQCCANKTSNKAAKQADMKAEAAAAAAAAQKAFEQKAAEEKAAEQKVAADKAAAVKTASEKAAAEKAAAEKAASEKAAAEKAAAEKAAAQRAAAEKAAAQKAETERLAAERFAAEKAAAEKAAAERFASEESVAPKAPAAKVANDTRSTFKVVNVFYLIGKNAVNESESWKVRKIKRILKSDETLDVLLSGYADKETGTPERNMQLSEERAKGVAAQLEEAGISSERISTAWYGDTVKKFEKQEDNRAVIAEIKK